MEGLYRNFLILPFIRRVIKETNRDRTRTKSFYNGRRTSLDTLDLKRSSEREIKRCRVEGRYDEAATEAIGTSYKGRTRHIVADKYGPPLFQMGDLVTFMKDTTPGVHWRFSYNKCGRTITTKVDA